MGIIAKRFQIENDDLGRINCVFGITAWIQRWYKQKIEEYLSPIEAI